MDPEHMNLHEYPGKTTFARYGCPAPVEFMPVLLRVKPKKPARLRRYQNCVGEVKCRVHAGGRGKAGGVKVVKGEGSRFAGKLAQTETSGDLSSDANGNR
ncbi:hypothetical protein KCP69_20900 [Salmonella enterica subsp. enterica]|nr:hypothetical protein KCP69_20900 [Salmonella enterica subsp. enterica]